VTTARIAAVVAAFVVVIAAAPAQAARAPRVLGGTGILAGPARLAPAQLVPALRLDVASLVDASAAAWAAASAVDDVAGGLRGAFGGGPREGAGLRVDGAMADVGSDDDIVAPRDEFTLPEHYAWIEGDTRAFWYATGTGAAATLAAHVLVGLPALVFGTSFLTAFANATPAATMALGLGLVTTYLFAESLLSSLIGTLTFNGTSATYQGNYGAALGAHFVGSVMSTGVTVLTFGGGLLLIHGAGLLSEFTAGGGLIGLSLFSVLGAMPGVVLAGVALVVVPALVTSWALAVTATPRPGFAIDDDWRKPTALLDDRRRDGRFAVVGAPIVSFALPSP
jgi:hypothetical protein